MALEKFSLIFISTLVFSMLASAMVAGQAETPQLSQERQQTEGKGPTGEQEKEPNQAYVPTSPTLPGYTEVELSRIASGEFIKELENKKVKVVVSSFGASKTKLGSDLASQFVPFDAYNYKQSKDAITVLVPKQMADMPSSLHRGQFVALYGQLMALYSRKTASGRPLTEWTGHLMLMVERMEPHQ